MNKIIVYTIGCPKCKQLEKKLTDKHIEYETYSDIEGMKALGIMSAPYLSVDGQLYDFGKAWKWINNQELFDVSKGNTETLSCASCKVE